MSTQLNRMIAQVTELGDKIYEVTDGGMEEHTVTGIDKKKRVISTDKGTLTFDGAGHRWFYFQKNALEALEKRKEDCNDNT